jgi:hypothetical protein
MVEIFLVCDALWQLSEIFLFPIFFVWILAGALSLVMRYFELMFRAATVAVLLIVGFLF